MSHTLINLTLPIVIQEIENVLDEYPEDPYQLGASQFGKNKRIQIIRELSSRIIWGFNLVVLPLLAQIQN